MEKIKIGIDLTYIKTDAVSGIKKYAEEILEGIETLTNNYEIVVFVDKYLQQYYENRFSKYRIVPIRLICRRLKYICNFTNLFFDRVHKIRTRNIIKRKKCNVVFYPYGDELTPIVSKESTILGILDIIPLDIIQDKKSIEYKEQKEKYFTLMEKTNTITTLSEYAKKRLLDINPDYKGKIEVIPSSVAKLNKTDKNIKSIIGSDNKYIFSINSFARHKNQITLVKAFNRIKEQIPHNLVLVGRPEHGSPISGYQDIVDYINKEKLNDRVKILSFISDEDRNALFYNTDLFVSTSMQEGFGRTPVEAAMCRVPVISTRETSLPEATKELVYYYNNPTDYKELADKILDVLNHKPSKNDLEYIANELEKEYNVEKITKKYIKLIEQVLKEKKGE